MALAGYEVAQFVRDLTAKMGRGDEAVAAIVDSISSKFGRLDDERFREHDQRRAATWGRFQQTRA